MTCERIFVTDMDLLHEELNAMGGCFDPQDLVAVGRDQMLGEVLAAVEKRGGRDPATIRGNVVVSWRGQRERMLAEAFNNEAAE